MSSYPAGVSFGAGALGVIGEAGPEAVLPLARTRDGRLGVLAGLPPAAEMGSAHESKWLQDKPASA